MKYLSGIICMVAGTLLVMTGCDKKDSVPYYNSGTAPVLTSSTTTVAATAADSLTDVISFAWTNPKYTADSNVSAVKYTLQVDSSGRNFAKAVSFVLSGVLADTLTAQQVNNVALSFGFSFNVAYKVDVRVIASYPNNNNQQTSNTLTITVTPYAIPPKVPVPANLYMVGDAVSTAPGTGWTAPVDTPYQKFTRIDSVTFGGIFNITGGNSYLLLPVANSFSTKYAIADASATGASSSGSFNVYTTGGSNFPAPATSGWYLIVVNFQSGTYTVTPYTGPTVPLAITPTPSTLSTGLWIIGDATPENPSWTNTAVALANQEFVWVTNGDYQLTLSLKNTGSYVFLPAAGDWNNKYGGTSATGGDILFDGAVPGSNTPAPAASGTYLIDVNFVTGKYTLTAQ